MPAFKVYLNGKGVTIAGVEGKGHAWAEVRSFPPRKPRKTQKGGASAQEEVRLSVEGWVDGKEEHLRWADRRLKVGDEVQVRIVADSPIDKPKKRERRDHAEQLRFQKRIVRQMARELGWTIQTGSKKP